MKLKSFGIVAITGLIAYFLVTFIGTTQVDERVEASPVKEVSSITNLSEATNSDGNKRLSGTSEVKDGRINYSFLTTDATKKEKNTLFETVLDKGNSLTIPFNSWASDDKFVFLTANLPTGKTYYVFNADGSAFNDGKKYLDVYEYWMNANMGKKMDHVSGWAGPGLLVVYATNEDGNDSFAYWFVISTRKFMNVREL